MAVHHRGFGSSRILEHRINVEAACPPMTFVPKINDYIRGWRYDPEGARSAGMVRSQKLQSVATFSTEGSSLSSILMRASHWFICRKDLHDV